MSMRGLKKTCDMPCMVHVINLIVLEDTNGFNITPTLTVEEYKKLVDKKCVSNDTIITTILALHDRKTKYIEHFN